jgi:O-antigen/teichoic acid export membrane protein
MFAGVSIFLDATQAELRLALSVLIIGEVVEELTQTNRMILVRQVQHRRLAFMQMVDSILSVLASIGLALAGFGIWALLINDILDAVTKVFFFWLWRPSWRPSLRWDRAAIRYFLRFGSQTFVGRFILEGLDRFDDIWTAIYLGNTQLGYYSRAFRFATYPRSFIAYPIYQVASGVYSELKGDRKRLSTAFMQINSFMVRSGFLLAGLIALVAPEFIRIALGDKWLPMLTAFQLMLVFTLFDPVKQTMANLFLALGLPGEVIWFRFIQLLVMIAGLFLLGFRFGIEGVALAVDIMLVVGMVLMLWRSKTYVDYSLRRLLVVPTVALFAGLAAGLGAVHWPNLIWSDWLSGIVKSILFVVIYSVILILWDRQQVKETWLLVRQNLMKG